MNKNFFSFFQWKNWFAFSRREKSGIVALLSILAAETIFLLWLHYAPVSHRTKTDFTAFEKAAGEFAASLDKTDHEKPGINDPPSPVVEYASDAKPFYFNPNKLSTEEWKQLGVRDRVVKTIQKYLAKGGRFEKKEDLRKIYGMKKEEYEKLESFIVLPESEKRNLPDKAWMEEKSQARKYKPAHIDIGIADTVELTHIRGVGVVFARRIHSYRNKLGGFLSTDQLKEVYGMNDTLYREIITQVYIADTSNIRRININSADYSTLRNHPYIGRNLAGIIVNYREQHGAFKDLEEVHKIPLVNDELYRKLAPYLTLE